MNIQKCLLWVFKSQIWKCIHTSYLAKKIAFMHKNNYFLLVFIQMPLFRNGMKMSKLKFQQQTQIKRNRLKMDMLYQIYYKLPVGLKIYMKLVGLYLTLYRSLIDISTSAKQKLSKGIRARFSTKLFYYR